MALSCCRGSIETIWSAALKYADGLSNPSALLLAIITMILSVALLAVAMRDLPLGTAYMVWTGIGAIGSFVVGVIFFFRADVRRAHSSRPFDFERPTIDESLFLRCST